MKKEATSAIPIYTAADAFKAAGVNNVKPFTGITLPFVPRKDQIEALNMSLRLERFGLFPEARCGKSIVMYLNALYCWHYGYKIVFTMPPVLFEQFVEDWEDLKGGPKPEMEIFNQGPKTRQTLLNEWERCGVFPPMLVMSKEIFKKHYARFMEAGYNMLVADEVHMGLLSDSTHYFEAIEAFIGGQDFDGVRLILSTGTPVPTNAESAYPSIKLRNPEIYQSKGHFDYLHVQTKQIKTTTRTGREVMINVTDQEAYKNLDLLHRNMYASAYRVTRAQVLPIKKPNIQILHVALSDAHMKLYKGLLKQKILMVGERLINAVQQSRLRMLSLQLVTDPAEYTERPIKNHMFEAVDQMLATADIQHNKVVVFANFTRTVEALREYLKKYNPAYIYGKSGDSQKEFRKFRNNSTCRVLIANPKAGGIGLKLGDVCQFAVFIEPMGSPGEFEQAAARILLTDQTKPVVIYILCAVGTGYVKAVDAMLNKDARLKTINLDPQTLLEELIP